MTTPSNPESAVPAIPPPVLPTTRPLYWSVRRELWENRSLYIAPLVVGGLLLIGFTISLAGLAQRAKAVAALPPDKLAAAIAEPYNFAALAIIATGFIVGFFYCLGALYNERRDRSILFWKSLPVSDLITVLSKAIVPLVVLPVIAFAIIVGLHVAMLLVHSAGRLANGISVAVLWSHLPLFQMEVVLLYGLTTLALWHAPIFAWLLLVSAWARRTPILWAVLPPLAVGLVEKIAFNTTYFGALMTHRLMGSFAQAFVVTAHDVKAHGAAKAPAAIATIGLAQLDPIKFLSSPGLWLGLVLAAAFLAAAVWLRRYREPI